MHRVSRRLDVAQGITKAKLAYKKRNAVPVTKKDAKDQRPTGRGGFGMGRGRDAPAGLQDTSLLTLGADTAMSFGVCQVLGLICDDSVA